MFGIIKVGEIAYICNSKDHPELNGMEVEVTHKFMHRPFFDRFSKRNIKKWCYVVRPVDNPYGQMNYMPGFRQLKRKTKKEPSLSSNVVTSWDNCAWKPNTNNVEQ